MKRYWLLMMMTLGLSAIPASAQTAAFNGDCDSGGRSAVTSGLGSTNKPQIIIPSCTVNVYLTGTTTRAAIFKDALGTPLSNPFTAAANGSTAPGQWLFYAATGVAYDVTMSGGIAPNTYVTPVTRTGLQAGGGGGGGACTGAFQQIAYFPAPNSCSGDPLFLDKGTALAGGLVYTGNGASFDAENSGSYIFTANDPNAVANSSLVQFNLNSAGGNSANFGVTVGPTTGGVNGGNIKLFTSGATVNGNNITLTALSTAGAPSGTIALEGNTVSIKADTTNMTLQSVGGINLISGSQPTTFNGGIAPTTNTVISTPYTIGSQRETTDLFNASGGAIVATLPTLAGDGRIFIAKKIDSSSNTVTIAGPLGQVEGANNVVLKAIYQWVALQYDAPTGNWHIFASGPFSTGTLTAGHCVQVDATGTTFIDSGVVGCSGAGGGGSAFNAITSGTNTAATMTVGTGATFNHTGSGVVDATAINGVTITGTPSVGQIPTATGSTTATWQAAPGAPSFTTLTGGTNTTAAMLVGTGASLAPTGSGTIAATTAVALAATPTACPANQYASGIGTNGNAICLALPTQPASQYIAPQAISGCGVEYVSGLSYTIGACTYSINGVIYNSPLTNITLSAADPTNPRIDAIYVDTTQTVHVLPGTPAATPQQPTVDPSTQLELTFVLVNAAATTPGNTTLVDIYLEGVEWTGAKGGTSGANVNLTSTNNPYSGTHDVEFGTGGTVAATTFAGFTVPSAGTVNLANYNTLTFYMRNKAAWATTNSITIQWFNGTTLKGTGVVISNGAFGWNATTNTTTYQQISIPTSTFGIAGIPVTSVRFTVSGSGAALTGFYLDQITLQGGSGGVILPSTLMNFKGVWSATATYNPNDVVTSGAIGYVALAQNTNVAVTTAATWSPLAPPASVTSIAAGTWPTWLTPTFSSSTGAVTLSVGASPIPNSALTSIGANTILGALTATTPSALPVPNCVGATAALQYTSGTGFSCGAIAGGGGGNTTSTSLTNNFLPKANGVNSIIDSKLSDDGTSLIYHGSGTIGSMALVEGSAATGVASSDLFYADSTTHRWHMINNNSTDLKVVGIATTGTANNCLKLAANGIDIVDTGSPCGSGTGNVSASGTLTNNALVIGQGTTAVATTTTGTGVLTALGVNTGSAGAFGVLFASGTAAMNTAAVASGACETVVTVSTTGIATTDVIEVGFNGDPTAVTGYGASATGAVLSIYPYPTTNNVNFKVCNSTSASITPGALTLNWKVYR